MTADTRNTRNTRHYDDHQIDPDWRTLAAAKSPTAGQAPPSPMDEYMRLYDRAYRDGMIIARRLDPSATEREHRYQAHQIAKRTMRTHLHLPALRDSANLSLWEQRQQRQQQRQSVLSPARHLEGEFGALVEMVFSGLSLLAGTLGGIAIGDRFIAFRLAWILAGVLVGLLIPVAAGLEPFGRDGTAGEAGGEDGEDGEDREDREGWGV